MMFPFRLPRLPDRDTVLQYLVWMRPRAGRITGILSGMLLAGPAWLYGLCVGFLLGYMVDSVRAKAATGAAEAGSDATTGKPEGEHGQAGPADDETSHTDAGNSGQEPDPTPYLRLGLLPGASTAEVKKAWRAQSRLAHPDAPGGEAENFMVLKSAYETIMEQRKAHAVEE